MEEKLENYCLGMEQSRMEYGKPFQYGEKLKTKLARQFELNNLLDMENRKLPEKERVQGEQNEQIPHVAETSHGYGAGREERR